MKCMKCMNCGADLPDGIKFCTNCGTKIENSKKIPRFCEKCGQSLSPNDKFCSRCGRNIRISPVSPSLTHTIAKPTAPQNTPAIPIQRTSDQQSTPSEQSGNITPGLSSYEITLFILLILSALIFLSYLSNGLFFSISLSVIALIGFVVTFLLHKKIVNTDFPKAERILFIASIIFLSLSVMFSFPHQKQSPPPSDTEETQLLMISIPFSSGEMKEMDHTYAKEKLLSAGFTNISEEYIEDLSVDNVRMDGIVENITLNDNNSFQYNDLFSADTPILITYHTIKTILAPLSSTDITHMDGEELTRLFGEAGFNVLSIKESFDLDPDETNEEWKNELIIGNSNSFSKDEVYPSDTTVQIVTHRKYAKTDLRIIIDFTGNWFFNKYDVILDIDGKTEKLAHGKGGTFTYRVRIGKNTIAFYNANDDKITGTVELDVAGETNVAYKITTYADRIGVKLLYLEKPYEIGENQAMVPLSSSDCISENYKDISNSFRKAGFSNITTKILYDINLGITKEGSVDSISIGGKTDFERGKIFNKDSKIVITYHMRAADDPSKPKETQPPKPKETQPPKQPETKAPAVETKPHAVETKPRDTTPPKVVPQMPVMKGTSLDTVTKVAKQYGLSIVYTDEDWGNGTKMRPMGNRGINIDIIYSTKTKELLGINIVTFTTQSTTKEQKEFIKAIAKVTCPSSDSSAVSSWVNKNIGGEKETKINDFTYHLFTGPSGNLCYDAGMIEWEDWDNAVSK